MANCGRALRVVAVGLLSLATGQAHTGEDAVELKTIEELVGVRQAADKKAQATGKPRLWGDPDIPPLVTELPQREGIFRDYILNPNLRSYPVSVSRYDDKGVHTGVRYYGNWRRERAKCSFS